jgi:hypothetical protein
MESVLAFIKDHGSDVVAIAGAVVMTARLIVKLTPTPKDDTFLDKVVTFLTHLGLKL